MSRGQEQLECRIVIGRLDDGRITLGMFCPRTNRYEPLGTHGPDPKVVEKAVKDLRDRIAVEGHLVTYSDTYGARH